LGEPSAGSFGIFIDRAFALALGAILSSLGAETLWGRRLLWGMSRLALGSIPAAHTVSNDFLHIAMTLVTTLVS